MIVGNRCEIFSLKFTTYRLGAGFLAATRVAGRGKEWKGERRKREKGRGGKRNAAVCMTPLI